MASSSAHKLDSPNHLWPQEPIPPFSVGYLSRKALPIKRNDAEPLTREDVQFDLLNYIFSDPNAVFTSQTQDKSTKETFKDLYINALFNSSKCSKVLKDKMLQTPAFALELAKISLLTNVGRINTTMAFFPEMKTALRTYHPVPSLQKSDGNAQDAPRIKNCLKAALLPSEQKSVPPSSPEEIHQKSRSGQRPPTSVVNLIFVLANHAAPLASVHFDGVLNFLDLFLPSHLSSASRGRAFLWHIFHYLEPEGLPNPFSDSFAKQNYGKAPLLHKLTDSQREKENVDTPAEIEWGSKKSAERNAFLLRLVSALDRVKSIGKNSQFISEPIPAPSKPRPPRQESNKDGEPFMHYVPANSEAPPLAESVPRPLTAASVNTYFPTRRVMSIRPPSKPIEKRTILEHACYSIMHTDPLLDSDDEYADEHLHRDYTLRLQVLSRLRGRAPTPIEPS